MLADMDLQEYTYPNVAFKMNQGAWEDSLLWL